MENVRYRILLIEDNELDQMAFKRFVENNAIPYDCTIANCVAQARQFLGSEQFDVVVTDHSLGDGTAFDILDSSSDTPVIVVTGAGDEETAVKAWKAGAYDYLVKDINQNYLKAIPITVENAIRHHMVEKKLQLLSGAVMSTEDSVYITDEGSSSSTRHSAERTAIQRKKSSERTEIFSGLDGTRTKTQGVFSRPRRWAVAGRSASTTEERTTACFRSPFPGRT